ncbi:MAG TPA: autotransporter domain-containing protein, partial [Xanthobacteraceae bacterium]|nr:autotransporter domain-containing protein [Xanthobacteraceae bacterium]
GGPTGISVTNASTVSGQISNAGTITADNGIAIGTGSVITNGILNTGMILAGDRAISLFDLTTFAGGITNAGLVSGSAAVAVSVSSVSTFSGGISNSGIITGFAGGLVVSGSGNETFLGGISNSGSITIAEVRKVGVLAGISVDNLAQFSNGIGNSGTISSTRTAVSVNNVATFTGGISNGGRISAGGHGIDVVASNFAGGIANSGTVNAAIGIDVSGLTFSGNIINTGSIAATRTAIGVTNISTFAGGISNNGTLSANVGMGVGFVPNTFPVTRFEVASVATLTGGVTNSGSITAGSAGIWVMAASSFAGGITNAAGGIITAQNGIRVGVFGRTTAGAYAVSNFSGGITNSGRITAATFGMLVTSVSTFSGLISNSGTIVVADPGAGISVDTVDTFAGGISNSGTITLAAGPAPNGISVTNVSDFQGGITNSGTLAGVGDGIRVESVSTFAGGISNGGFISVTQLHKGGVFGIGVTDVAAFGSTSAGGGITNGGVIALTNATGVGIRARFDSLFIGGVTNSGTITGGRYGITVGGFSLTVSTFSGGLTNSGHISTTSSGTGIIVGANSFVSGHIVNSGTISAAVAINLGGAGNAITIDQNAGLIAGNILLSPFGDTLYIRGGMVNGNVLGQGNGDTVNFALGSGSFTYAAPFAMTGLSQVNFNSGTAFIDGSITATTLTVNSGGAAAGTGTLAGDVTVMAGGTLMPGNLGSPLGTLNVTGSVTFNAGGFYSVHASQAAASATTIGGPGIAMINGGNVTVTLLQAGSYNQTYTILTANGGRAGAFSGIVNTNAAFAGTEALSYDATHVFLTLDGIATLGAVPLVAPGPLSANQQNVLNGINNFIAPGNVLPPGFQNLYNLSGPTLASALMQLSGANNAGFSQSAFQAGSVFLGLMVNPFVDGRFGSGGSVGPGIGFAPGEPPALPQAAAAFASAMPLKAAPPMFNQRFSAWGAAYGGSGNVRGDPFAGSSTTTASVAVFAAGIDYRAGPDTTLGFALAGGGTNWGLDSGQGNGRSDFFQAGLYGSHHWGNAYLSGAFAYNFHDVTTNRTLTVAGTDMLQARFQANGVGARLEGGYRYAMPWLGITSYAAAQVQSIFLPSYGETATAGSKQFALNFARQTATTTRAELGAWFDKSWLDHTALLARGTQMTLYGRLAWAHDFGDTSSASAIFQSLPGSSFIVNGAAPARDGALVTTGAKYDLMNGWSFTAKFDGEFSSTTSIYSGTGMVKKVW